MSIEKIMFIIIMVILFVNALIIIWDNNQPNAATISLKESEWKCTETEHSKDRDGCVVLEYIGDNQ